MAPLSVSGTGFVNEPDKDDAFVALVEIDHPSFASPIRLAGNTEELVSSGTVYNPVGLRVALPSEEEDDLPQVKLEIADIDQTVTIAMRNLDHQVVERATITANFVRGNQPDWIEQGPHEYELLTVEISNGTVILTLGYQNIGRHSFPSKRVTPECFQLF